MNKNRILCAALLAAATALQAQTVLTRYSVRDAGEIRLPIMNDSINPRGEKHSVEKLLETPVTLQLPGVPTDTLEADSTGTLTLTRTEKNYKMYVLTTQIRAEQFAKGKLKVSSPVRWEAFVDGTSRLKKTTAEDSTKQASPLPTTRPLPR